jgi:hypothetical protein
MAENNLRKQRAQGRGRGPGRPFAKGVSGNPAGRAPGSRNKATEMAQALLDGQADAIVQKCIELAIEGHPAAIKLCLERLVPRQARSVRLDMPRIAGAADLASAMGALAEAVAAGAVSPYDGAEFSRILETYVRALETGDFERRLAELEKIGAAGA